MFFFPILSEFGPRRGASERARSRRWHRAGMRVYASRECTEAVSRLYMFHTGEDHSAMALAIDRRRALEDEEEAEEAEE